MWRSPGGFAGPTTPRPLKTVASPQPSGRATASTAHPSHQLHSYRNNLRESCLIIQLKVGLLQESVDYQDGFLTGRHQFLQIFPRSLQFGFLGFAGITKLRELGFDFISRSFGFDGFLQIFHFGARGAETAAALAIAALAGRRGRVVSRGRGAGTGSAAAALTITTIAAAPTKSILTHFLLRVHHLADGGFEDLPFGIILHI